MVNIVVHNIDNMSEEEKRAYLDHMKEKYPDIKDGTLDIYVNGDYVTLKFSHNVVPFQRIRRITGYLVGTLDRFNDAKKSEVEDRVKHNV